MRWKKLGRIFDPTAHSLANGCVEFAQSPQALVFDDVVRIYFSTRAVDEHGGKYRSHVSFVDMNRRFDRTLDVASHTVIELGGLGCFDEHGIFPMTVVRHGDRVLGYTCGWSRRVSVSVETAIGLAVSDDEGHTFQRVGPGPVMATSLHEPCLVGDGFVRIIEGVFHMWYIFGIGWRHYEGSAPDRIYKIGHAVSSDGIHWNRNDGHRIIEDVLGPDECQALPTVIEIAGRHHMFFCFRQATDFRHNRDRAYRIGHAYSDDLVCWTRDDDRPRIDVTAGAWDSDMLCYPGVFECGGDIYMLYNGNAFGRHGFGLAVLE